MGKKEKGRGYGSGLCHALLHNWCGKLLKLQIREGEDGIRGGILCPACGFVHGRCVEAVYPFLRMAEETKDNQYIEGAKMLFEWAEQTVSREDGSLLNDINSQWKGTTVFYAVSMAEAILFHGHLLDGETLKLWSRRLLRAAEFLYGYEEFNICNVNYRITNCLAMYLCGQLFHNEKYGAKAEKLASQMVKRLEPGLLLYGEGRPVDGFTPKGCRPVDVGYNMEESLPMLTQYAWLKGDEGLKTLLDSCWRAHVEFMLEDGGIDNSFGTRNYKWTYWGSRTSDGCGLGLLFGAEKSSVLGAAALRNMELLQSCTHDGLLCGGPHIGEIKERTCIHHTFTHAKVLAGILDYGLEALLQQGALPRTGQEGFRYYKETDTVLVGTKDYTATVTGYDWEYVKAGHGSGGSLCLLYHHMAGLIVCSSVGRYVQKEPNNMQLPRFRGHECLSPRLEAVYDGRTYSSIYEFESTMDLHHETAASRVLARGRLADEDHWRPACDAGYEIDYEFDCGGLTVNITMDMDGEWIFPIISSRNERAVYEENHVVIDKGAYEVIYKVLSGTLMPVNCEKRIYHLVPGLQAVKTAAKPAAGALKCRLEIRKK